MDLLTVFLFLDATHPVVLLILAVVVLVAMYFLIRFILRLGFTIVGYVLTFFLPFRNDN